MQNKNIELSKFKLSLLLFSLFISFGSVMPIISLYLQKVLCFTPSQTGLILSLGAISSLITPIVGAIFADRIISSEKLFSILISISGLILLFIPSVTQFSSFFPLYMIYALVFGPSMSLMNTIIFHHVKGGSNNYGFIRVWGTIGWIVTAWVFGYFWLKSGDTNSKLYTAFYLSGTINIVVGSIIFFVPSALSKIKKKIELFPRASLNVVLQKDVLIICFIVFLSYFTDAFYVYGAAPFLKSINVADHQLLPILSIGQVLEIPAMFLLAKYITKIGFKKVIIIGALSNLLRYVLLVNSSSILLSSLAALFHGPAYALVFSTAYIYIDKRSNKENRAGVQQYYAILTGGIGSFLGNNAAGFVSKINTLSNITNFSGYWLVPFSVSIMIILFTIIFFKPITVENN